MSCCINAARHARYNGKSAFTNFSAKPFSKLAGIKRRISGADNGTAFTLQKGGMSAYR
jgi:hypothetical protein